jgi:hypothetical protein
VAVFLPRSSTGRGFFASLIEILLLFTTEITRHTTTVTDSRPAAQPVSETLRVSHILDGYGRMSNKALHERSTW